MKVTKKDWKQFFPFKEIRSQQEDAINFAIESFKTKTNVVLELSPGVGKSGIAITLAKYYKNAWLLTPQKILQTQYVNDFNWLPSVWSKESYECTARPGINCRFGNWINTVLKTNVCDCIYTNARKNFIDNPISLTNMMYFLNNTEYTTSITSRSLLVIDETHNLDDVITGFVSIKLNKYNLNQYNIYWKYTKNISDVVDWIQNTVVKILSNKFTKLKYELKLSGSNGLSVKNKKLINQIDYLDRYICSLNRCILYFNKNNWVMTINDNNNEYILRPLSSKYYSEQQLFKYGNKRLLMSATILDKDIFCDNVGLNKEDTAFLSLPSPFKKENRQIYIQSSGSMSRKNIDKTLPIIAKNVKLLIDSNYKNKSGIIFTHTYKIANYIANYLNDSRILLHDSTNRLEIYKLHLNSKKPTILISPSLTEGIDLIDDLSRFQLILKIPFPYLGDKYITTKKDYYKGWYEWSTIKTIIQTCGRSVRHNKDYCDTIIMDSDFLFFYNRNKKMFPKWYRDSIEFI